MDQEESHATNNERELELNTQVVHAGERLAPPSSLPVVTPVYATTTFTYDSMAEMDEVFGGDKEGYVYTRFDNPTVHALETAMQTLEAGAGACAFASGMAATHAALLVCDLSPGASVLAAQDLYGATTDLLFKVFANFGVRIHTVDFNDKEKLRATALEVKPRAMLAETISNPLLRTCDIEAAAQVSREVGACLIIDNTFASPYLCQPLRFGADIVIHSATKYLSGHADATGGIAIARESVWLPALISAKKLIGGVLSVWEAHQIMRGIKTLGVRLERQCANARQLAERLEGNPRIARVFHPGFGADQSRNEIVRRMLRTPHTGALVSIELVENTREAAFRFMDALRLCVRLTSLGDVMTSVLHPMTASHRGLTPKQRQQVGIGDGLVRISVGIEDISDIIKDIEQALTA